MLTTAATKAALVALLAGQFTPPPVVPTHAFGPEEIMKFRQQEHEQRRLAHDTRIAEGTLRRAGCGSAAAAIAPFVAASARKYHVAVRLVASVLVVESSCRVGVVSNRGAVGLMQVSPRTWHMSRVALRDPRVNVDTGTRILAGYTRAYGTRDGLKHYLGLGPNDGQITSDQYADKVLAELN